MNDRSLAPVPRGTTDTTVFAGRHFMEQDLIELFLQRFDRENTRLAYRQDLEDFFAFLTGTTPSEVGTVTLDLARAVTFVDINRYLSDLEARGLASSSRRRRLASVRGLFALLINLQVLTVNPAAREVVRRIPKAKTQDAPIIVLTKDQARRLVEAASLPIPPSSRRKSRPVNAPDPEPPDTWCRDTALILTMIHACLRRSEAAAIMVDHIRPVGAFWVLDLPRAKGGENQWVKLHSRTVDAIEEMKRHYAERFGWDFSHGPLFRSLSNRNLGERLAADGIYRVVRRLAERAELFGSETTRTSAPIRAHTLRHTGCTLAIEGGATLQQVQIHARHKDLSTTMRYVHQRDKLRDSAADHISF